MKAHASVEQQSTGDIERMLEEFAHIRELADAQARVTAWSHFLAQYEANAAEDIIWRAHTYLTIDRASAAIDQLLA